MFSQGSQVLIILLSAQLLFSACSEYKTFILTGLPQSGKIREKQIFFQGQGKVGELHIKSGNF